MKKSLAMAAALVFFFFPLWGAKEMAVAGEDSGGEGLEAGSVLMVIAHDGFRDEEYRIPRSVLEQNGLKVVVASSDTTVARGMLGLELTPDLLIKDARVEDYDCFIFVGGVGAKAHWDDESAHLLVKSALDSGKVLGAICIAPVTLAKAGVLKGRKATVFRTRETMRVFEKEGVIYTGDAVTVSGKVVTARDPKAAEKFAGSILALLPERREAEERE